MLNRLAGSTSPRAAQFLIFFFFRDSSPQKMRSVLSLIAIAVIATATTEIRQSDEHDYFQPNSYPYHNLASVDPRQEMMTFSLIFPVRQTRPTIMEFTTSTSTIVCTKYVDTPCSLRTSTVERPERPSRRPAWFIRRGRPLPVYPETYNVTLTFGKQLIYALYTKYHICLICGRRMENERDADILMDEDMEQQFTIFPTAVQR